MIPAKSLAGTTSLIPADYTLILIDHQPQMVFATKSIDPTLLMARC